MHKPLMYAILQRTGRFSHKLLLEYTSLEKAAAYMKTYNLEKVNEQRFMDYGLVQWFVK